MKGKFKNFSPHITEFSLRPIWNGNGEYMSIVCTIQTTPNETQVYRFNEINMKNMTLSFINKIMEDILRKIQPGNFMEIMEIFDIEAKKILRTTHELPDVQKRKRADVNL